MRGQMCRSLQCVSICCIFWDWFLAVFWTTNALLFPSSALGAVCFLNREQIKPDPCLLHLPGTRTNIFGGSSCPCPSDSVAWFRPSFPTPLKRHTPLRFCCCFFSIAWRSGWFLFLNRNDRNLLLFHGKMHRNANRGFGRTVNRKRQNLKNGTKDHA